LALTAFGQLRIMIHLFHLDTCPEVCLEYGLSITCIHVRASFPLYAKLKSWAAERDAYYQVPPVWYSVFGTRVSNVDERPHDWSWPERQPASFGQMLRSRRSRRDYEVSDFDIAYPACCEDDTRYSPQSQTCGFHLRTSLATYDGPCCQVIAD
jgi:hypothetical protein